MIDGLIRVAYVNEYTRSDHNEMLAIVWATKKREISSILSMNQRHVIKNRLLHYSWKTKDIVEALIFTCTFLLRISSESSDTSILT